MSCDRAALREELNGRLLPELRRLGFEGPPRIAGNVLLHEYRRAAPYGTDVLRIQLDKEARPRFVLLLHVEPGEGLAAVMARGGTILAGGLPWFRADPRFWQRWIGETRTREREAVAACIALLPEVEDWWREPRATAHIRVWPVTYVATAR